MQTAAAQCSHLLPAAVPFTKDVTYWNPSWSITHGAIQTTNIDDMHTSAVAIGTGRLLKLATFQQMITKDLIDKTTAVKGVFADERG